MSIGVLNWSESEPLLIIIAGFILFIIPEPATSTFGIGLMLLGFALWFDEWRG